jgi:hypothetical protein
LGDHLADMPCVALGRPTCGRADVPCVACLAFALRTCLVGAPNLRTCLALPSWGAQLGEAVLKSLRQNVLISSSLSFSVLCVDALRMRFAFGRPSCGRALCVALRTCGRSLHCGRLHLRCRPVLGRPTCGRALRCVGVPNLRTCLTLRLGAHLADVPCVALGRPTLVRPY